MDRKDAEDLLGALLDADHEWNLSEATEDSEQWRQKQRTLKQRVLDAMTFVRDDD